MKTAIWWIRRDLRLNDNQALSAALASAETVIPLFILDPQLLASPNVGPSRLAFLFASLRSLADSLLSLGSSLIVRQGPPLDVLSAFCAETSAEAIFAEADVSPYARQRDQLIGRIFPLNLVSGLTIFPPQILLKPDGTPYTVFTPFSRMWRNLPIPGGPTSAPRHLLAIPALHSLQIPSTPLHPLNSPFPATEAEALRRLSNFSQSAMNAYSENRDRMDLDGTSRLSPYLRFGLISARQVAAHARIAASGPSNFHVRQGAETWLNELIWREFYAAILYHFPLVRHTAFRPQYRHIPWRNDPDQFSAWCSGRTGYPVVDAAMRQLNVIGWMHNRARMIVASFLTKDLLIDWRLGERYFMQHLLDGDPAANNGGWQWAAGTGTDAAPYFRIFNPVLQSRKFDPHGNYIRRWVPELENVPLAYIHSPWQMPPHIQEQVGCRIGHHYPAPIVDHQQARQRVLAAYRQGGISDE